MQRVAAGAIMGVDVVALALLRSAPGDVIGEAGGLRAWVEGAGVDGVTTALAAAGLWGAAAWVAVGLLAAVVGRLPGAAGRLGLRVAQVTLPAALRRVVAGSAGLGVLLAPVVAQAHGAPHAPARDRAGVAAAHAPSHWQRPLPASPPAPASPSSAASGTVPGPMWPGVVPGPTPGDGSMLPGPGWPSSPPAAPTTPAAGSSVEHLPPPTAAAPSAAPRTSTPRTSTPRNSTPRNSTPRNSTPSTSTQSTSTGSAPDSPSTAPASPHTVQAGDSLWLLAAHRLGARATDRDVAAYWPRVYAANRAVIGDDPSLIAPGQVLHLPAPDPQETP